MSNRTLRRHLNEIGVTYLNLLDEVKYKEAATLLLKSDMEIQGIALYLGYIQPANFARAFKNGVECPQLIIEKRVCYTKPYQPREFMAVQE